MIVVATEQDHIDAVKAVLDDAGAVPYTVQDANRVSVLPPAYNSFTVEPRAGGVLRITATTDARGYRIAVQSCGKTYDEAVAMRIAADAALRGASLVVGSGMSTPIQFESAQPVDDQDRPGWYVGSQLYTYVH